MWKWSKRIGLGLVVLVSAALLAGVIFEQWSRHKAASAMKPPGEIVPVDGRHLHIRCLGQGVPTVVLEAGLGPDASASWDTVIEEIAEVTRVCAYDRAGLLWSEPGEKPRDAERITRELHALLANAGESAPYVLAGHSLGGLLVRVYAGRYPGDVVGLVLVDSSHPDQMERFSPEVRELMEEMMPSPLLMKLMATTGVLRLMKSGQDYSDPVTRLLPRSIPGLLAEVDSIEEMGLQAGKRKDLGDLTLVVLTAGQPPDEGPPGMTEEIKAEIVATWRGLQEELAALSTQADHRILDDAKHYIHHDRPDAVIEAIAEVVKAAREELARSELSPGVEP